MAPDPRAIDDYIRQNHDRYTREAVRDQLLAAGHDPAAIDAAWARVDEGRPAATPLGWRPGWREYLLLLVVGAIGAAIVWAGEPYGAGMIAPVAYAVILTVGFGAAKLISILIDRGSSTAAAVFLGLVGGAAIWISIASNLSLIAMVVAALSIVLVVLVLVLRGPNQRVAGTIGAALPILVWLGITGTCYAPLIGG
jgi:hypothetical protein